MVHRKKACNGPWLIIRGGDGLGYQRGRNLKALGDQVKVLFLTVTDRQQPGSV